MAIKITSQEFNKKFGSLPTTTSQPTQPSEGIGSQISTAFKGGLSQAKEGFQHSQNATNPIQLIEGGLKQGAGIASAAFSPLAPLFKPVGDVINYTADKISNIPAVQDFAMSNAGQTTSRIAEDVANTATIAGTVAGVKTAPKIGGAITDTAGTVAKGVQPAIRTTGRALKGAGESSYGLTITPQETTSIALRNYKAKYPDVASRIKAGLTGNELDGKPITEANTAARLGLHGTEQELGVQATRFAKDIWESKVAPALDSVKGKVNMKDFFTQIEKDIFKKEVGTRRGDLLEAVRKLKEDYKGVNKVSLKKLQDYKEKDWAQFIPEASYRGKPIGAAFKAVQDLAAKKARETIYKFTPEGTREAYIDYGNLKSIMKAADKSTKDPATRSLGRNVWQFVMDKAVTPVATTAGKILYKTGEGLEFTGKPGAKTVSDIVEGNTKKSPKGALPKQKQ